MTVAYRATHGVPFPDRRNVGALWVSSNGGHVNSGRDKGAGVVLEWSDQFRTGFRVIDRDHQNLFSVVKDLDDAIARGDVDKHFAQILHSLRLYADEHFAREERFMTSAKYPDVDLHIAQHRQFEAMIGEIAEAFKEEPGKVDPAKVRDFLSHWLVSHILKVDMEYIPTLSGDNHEPAAGFEAAPANVADDGIGHRVTFEVEVPAEYEDSVRNFVKIVAERGRSAEVLREAVSQLASAQDSRLHHLIEKKFFRDD